MGAEANRSLKQVMAAWTALSYRYRTLEEVRWIKGRAILLKSLMTWRTQGTAATGGDQWVLASQPLLSLSLGSARDCPAVRCNQRQRQFQHEVLTFLL